MNASLLRSGAEPSGKWEVQIRKGCIELAILSVLWSERLYGLEILRRLATDSAFIIPEGTVYPLLTRLKGEGLLSSEWVATEGGHPRKYYTLTAGGRRRAIEMFRFWSTFSANIDLVLVPLRKAAR